MAIAFLLDNGASISGPNIPTYGMITQMFNVRNHDKPNTAKTLIFANQSEVPMKQNISVPCFSSNTTYQGIS